MYEFGNVTVDLLSFCTPAKQLEIEEILDLDTGEHHKTRDFIRRQRYQEIIPIRHEVRERWKTERPRFVCSVCGVPVALLAQKDKNWFFRHSVEDGSCHAQTKASLDHDEIRARKYHGLRESDAHHRIKSLLRTSLEVDASFSAVVEEQYFRSALTPEKRRRPDVAAKRNGIQMAFEIQLSTTFLDVVLARREFYRNEGFLLTWVLPSFDPVHRRLTDDDIFVSNNLNVLVVNESTRDLSIERERAHFLCWYREPVFADGVLSAVWRSRMVAVDDLLLDITNQRTYFFDYEGTAAALLKEEEERKIAALHLAALEAEKEKQALRDDFEKFWCVPERFKDWPSRSATWQALTARFRAYGVELPDYPFGQVALSTFLNAIYSAKVGASIGWDFPQLTRVAHFLFDERKWALLAFGYAVEIFGQRETVKKHDPAGKWAGKAAIARNALRERQAAYLPDETLQPLTGILFPEIHDKIAAYISPSPT